MTDVIREIRFAALGIAVMALLLLLVAVDLVEDHQEGVSFGHLGAEGGMFGIAAVGLVVFVFRFRDLRRDRRELRRQLASSREDADYWRREAAGVLAGLASAIDCQFDRWELTHAEREIALLLLRGLSHRQIADLRGVSERTVRQQAHLLYRKAGFRSRADLAGFFFDDLLQPREPRIPDRPAD